MKMNLKDTLQEWAKQCHPGQLSAKIKELIRSGWIIMQMSYLVND